ncbi:MAG: mandelate racemase/muconate lactonizing enzyme family protein [Candidatus Bathyarchaeota archaeon]|nr:mandelate racemase/muconate lactonizing enzyme family protein [Candidatus Bathyarchaeota archaeon]
MISTLEITKVETIPVSIPVGFFKDGMCKVRGVNAPDKYYTGKTLSGSRRTAPNDALLLDNIIVKIHTDEDITGIGAAAPDVGFFGEPWESVKIIIDNYMGPRIIGMDPFDREQILHIVTRTGGWHNVLATSGIDLALHDLLGKAMNTSVCNLLGGCHQDKILLSTEVPRGVPEKMAEHSLEYYEQGVRGFKAKVGSDPLRDALSLKAMRDAMGDKISIRADANQAYTPKEAIKMCQLTQKFDVDLELLEQPTKKWDLDGMARITKTVDIPIEADESAFSLFDVMRIIKKGAADVINAKIAKAGGFYGVKKWAAVAESAGLATVVGTEWGVGSQIAAKLHLGGSTKTIHPVIEFTEIMIHETLLSECLELKDGYLDVPTGPGLGLELDPKKVEKYMNRDPLASALASASRESIYG